MTERRKAFPVPPPAEQDRAQITPYDPVAKLLARTPVYVYPDATLAEVAVVLAEESIGAALVRGPHGPVGIVSERDLVQAIAEGADPERERVRDVMTPDLAAVDGAVPILTASDTMLANEIRHLAVTIGGTTIGLVSMRDVMAVLADEVWPGLPAQRAPRMSALHQELAHPGG